MVKSNNDPAVTRESPVMLELLRLDTGSAVALVGHPIHVMMVHFPIAFVIATLGVDFSTGGRATCSGCVLVSGLPASLS